MRSTQGKPVVISTGELAPRPSSATPVFYGNHVVIGDGAYDSTLVFGHLSSFSGLKGLQFPQGKERGTFEPVVAVTLPKKLMPDFAKILLMRLAAQGFPVNTLLPAEGTEAERSERQIRTRRVRRG